MRLHLVGGFLGSGKTTAIIHAAKRMMDRGLRVGVITNDQGKFLVDTAFFQLGGVPAVEVTGGCFCCNYDDLDVRLAQLMAEMHPDVVFAESVGSCADVVATVVKPLLALAPDGIAPASFSVFTDARLLRRRLLDQELPFSEDVLYIFDKQIEEAGLLVVNKVDLLPQAALSEVEHLLQEKLPGKSFLVQSALTPDGVRQWIERIEVGGLELPPASLEIDYDRYGAGEARLAWLDEEIRLSVPAGHGRAVVMDLLARFAEAIRSRGASIGHVKFIVESEKISLPTLEEPGWLDRVPDIPGGMAVVLVNARVEMPSDELRTLLRGVLDETGFPYTVNHEAAFHPDRPKPTHRME